MGGTRTFEKRGRARPPAILLLGALGAVAFGPGSLGCERHELVFPGTATGGGGGEVAATGGAPPAGSGGRSEIPGEGGGPFWPPCIATDNCVWPCSVETGCAICETADDCGFALPHCDVALGGCVECLVAAHCEERYGFLFPACSAGRCVQCQSDEDCGSGVRCRSGWCGSCDSDRECADGFECVRDHCLPRE